VNVVTSGPWMAEGSAALTEEDLRVLGSVEGYLADGLALKHWWEEADRVKSYEQQFKLERTFNRPGGSYGFFGQAPVRHGTLPVMGSVQDMFYDRPNVPPGLARESTEWMGEQIREFVLHYFMRVSSFRQPEPFAVAGRSAPPSWLGRLSWCPEPRIVHEGFGFSQLFYKLSATGEIGKFSTQDEFAIVDLREIGKKYEWIVLKVRIFDFNLRLRPFGANGPELVFGLNEESYLVLSSDFIVDQSRPTPGVIGRYGLGYAFIKSPTQGLVAYGPGEFDAAFELIQFEILESGEINVHMVFVVNRPNRIANVVLDPLDWSFRIADLMTLGVSSKFLAPVKNTLDMFPIRLTGFDPVFSFIALANTLSAGQAAEQLCISKEQLDKAFLLQHFMQHYQTIVGSLLTWRQIGNWLDSNSVPEWVVTGRGS
jgi:hypothetical protein